MSPFHERGTVAEPVHGWVHLSSPGLLLGSPGEERARLDVVSSDTLRAAGIGQQDRVLVALTSDGVMAGPQLARGAVDLGASAACVSPRGRTRVIRTLRSFNWTTLITTPCGAADLLARIFIEFGLQPEDLGLQRVLVAGEIASPGTVQQLADEFDCEVGQLLLDPFTGAALGQGVERFEVTDTEAVVCSMLDRDDLATPGAPGAYELVVRLNGNVLIRSGVVVVGKTEPDMFPFPTRTVGDHVLARGRWLSLPAIDRALAGIDGIARWHLDLSREGTLDRVVAVVALDRPTLVDDPMWAGRIREAVESVVPVRVEIRAVGVDEDVPVAGSATVIDHRGHHLGTDRKAAARAFPPP